MARSDELTEALKAAKLALLAEAKEAAEQGVPSRMIAAAEAYAWVDVPNNSHGGGPPKS